MYYDFSNQELELLDKYPNLKLEIDCRMLDYTDDIQLAFNDTIDFLDYDSNGYEKEWKELKQFLIETGRVKEVDISKVQVSSGKRYWFKFDKKHFDLV